MVLLIGMTPLPNLILANAGNLTEKSIGGVNAYELQDQGFRIEYVLEVLFFMWMIFKNYNKIDMDKRTLTFFEYDNWIMFYFAILYEIWTRWSFRMAFLYRGFLYDPISRE